MSNSLTEKQQFWSEQLQRAEQSGVSLADYARANNLNPQKLYQWRSTLKKQVTTSVTTETHFAQVIPGSVDLLSVHLPSAQLSFTTLPDAEWLVRVIAATSAAR